MKLFIKQLSLFLLFPILLLIIGYLYFDPFKVLYNYEDYAQTPVVLDRDYVSTKCYLEKRDKYNYDSFIFGSSRAHAFKASAWEKHLNAKNSVYTFDAAGESMYGIYDKLVKIDQHNSNIQNVIIVLCRDWSFIEKKGAHSGHLFKKHPDFSEKTWLNFHFTFFKSYLNTKFLLAYYNHKVTGKFKPWMTYIISNDTFILDKKTNEMNVPRVDSIIESNLKLHVESKKDIFYERKGEIRDSINRITPEQLTYLVGIKKIINKNKTKLIVIGGPSYDQCRFSKKDEQILKNIFGSSFYDYTGKNKYTDNKENYYETSHYRKNVGEGILNEIYAKK